MDQNARRGYCGACYKRWQKAGFPVTGPPGIRRPPGRRPKSYYDKRRSSQARQIVLNHYGQRCECCGATEDLTVDHINGDGRAERQRATGGDHGGNVFYYWLIKNGLPPGIQVLCKPCNSSKRAGTRCRIYHAPDARQCSRCRRRLPPDCFPAGLKRCEDCVEYESHRLPRRR